MTNPNEKPVFRDGFWISELRAMHAKFNGYRDYAPVGPDSKKGSGQILPFVRGLYLSAQVIYLIRSVIQDRDIEVHWGHIIHDSQIYCSPECDIIIHRGKSIHRWNGDVLDFHFVDLSKVIAVVSCKSIVTTVDADYCAKLKSFGVKSVVLFGESCSATNFANMREKAKAVGYDDFWCLALEEDGNTKYDEAMLLEFIRFLEAIKI